MVDLVALTLSVGALHYPAGAPRDFFLPTTPLLVVPISAKGTHDEQFCVLVFVLFAQVLHFPTCTRFTADRRLHPLDLKSALPSLSPISDAFNRSLLNLGFGCVSLVAIALAVLKG